MKIIKYLVLFIFILVVILIYQKINKGNGNDKYYDKKLYIKYAIWDNYYKKILAETKIKRKYFLSNSTEYEKRKKLYDLLGINQITPDYQYKIISKSNNKNIQIIKYIFTIKKGFQFSCIALIPNNNNSKGIIALPATNWGIEIISGINDYSWFSYGKRLAENSFIVIIPELPLGNNNSYKESLLQLTGVMTGKPIIGEWVDISRVCLSFLENDLKISQPFGVIGWSLGGMVGYYTIAVDNRISVLSVMHFLGTYEKLNLEIGDHISNYIPNILNYFEFYDISSLIVPRKLFFQVGMRDEKFPFENSKIAFEKIKEYYRKSKVPNNLKFQIIKEGGHRPVGSLPLQWIINNL